MDILDTLSYDVSEKEGGAYIRTPEAELDKIGLNFTLEKITPTGATLVFHQYDEKAPTGELEYGDAFVLEILKNNQWEKKFLMSSTESMAFTRLHTPFPSGLLQSAR